MAADLNWWPMEVNYADYQKEVFADMINRQNNWNEAGVEAGEFEAFRQVVAALRSEKGCPWDREQTFESLKPCMINEMTEAIAAINIYKEEKDASNLCEELGDVLLQVVLLAQIAQEEGLFRIEDVIREISRKMIRRHPHVFPNPEMDEAVRKLQEQQKTDCTEERADAADGSDSQKSGKEAVKKSESASEIPGLWELIKQAEKKDRPYKNKEKEKAAFTVAGNEIIEHLEQKIG